MPRGFSDHYRPDRQSRKRPRTELSNISQLRNFSNSYRPSYEDDKPSSHNERQPKRQKQDFNSYRPEHRADTRPLPQTSSELPRVASSRSSNKTKHDRKSNPSSRIHSLRNLLARDSDNLPRTVRQEKERELTALLLDQEKAKLRRESRQNLQRYHMVRFFERKKAERNLKKLLKRRDEILGQDSSMKEDSTGENETRQDLEPAKHKLLKSLNRAIHECETDIAYTIYSPLGSKYISLFVEEPQHSQRPENKVNGKKRVFSMFTESEKRELRNVQDEQTGIMRNAAGEKPPLWFEVERCKRDGGTAMLEKLRDGKLKLDAGGSGEVEKKGKELVAVGGRDEVKKRRSGIGSGGKRKASFLEESGHIDPADLDSDDDDDEMSDGDGGFFEK